MDDSESMESFLSCIDKVHNIVHAMKDNDKSAMENANKLIQELDLTKNSSSDTSFTSDRTVINKAATAGNTLLPQQTVGGVSTGPSVSQHEFTEHFERDAKERADRRSKNRISSEKHRLQGNEYFKNKNYEAAVESYTTALRLYPDSVILYTNRAQAFLKLERFPDALSDCDWALRLHERHPKALARKGLALRGIGKFDAALSFLEKARKSLPSNKRGAIEQYIAETKAEKEQKERDLRVLGDIPEELNKSSPDLYSVCMEVLGAYNAVCSVFDSHNVDNAQGEQCPSSIKNLLPIYNYNDGDEDNDNNNDESILFSKSILEHATESEHLLQTLSERVGKAILLSHNSCSINLVDSTIIDRLRIQGADMLLQRVFEVSLLMRFLRQNTTQHAQNVATNQHYRELFRVSLKATVSVLNILRLLTLECDIFAKSFASHAETSRILSLFLKETSAIYPSFHESILHLLQVIAQSTSAAKVMNFSGVILPTLTIMYLSLEHQHKNVLLAAYDTLSSVCQLPAVRAEVQSNASKILSRIFQDVNTSKPDQPIAVIQAAARTLSSLSCVPVLRTVLASRFSEIMGAAFRSRQERNIIVQAYLLAACSNIGLEEAGLEALTAGFPLVSKRPPIVLAEICVSAIKEYNIHVQEKTISSNKYEEVIKLKAHAAAVIARLCSTQDGCDQVVACEGVSCLVGLLFHENSDLIGHSLRALAKLMKAVPTTRQLVFDLNALPQLTLQLSSTLDNIVGNAALCLSEMFLLDKVVSSTSDDLLKNLLEVAKREKGPVQKNAATAIARLCKHPVRKYHFELYQKLLLWCNNIIHPKRLLSITHILTLVN